MAEGQINVHALDAAYQPFPSFSDWAAKTSVDSVRWDRYSASIKARSAKSSDLKKAYEVVKRAAAIDTGAIEGLYDVDRGFTYTVAFETAAWEIALADRGENVRSLFEAQLHAYDYVLDLATKAEPISEAAIRILHEVVCQAQETYRVQTPVGFQEQTLPKGKYKVLPNHVLHTREGTNHSYAPVDVTPAEMARLVHEMRSDDFNSAHPILQAAYAHYGLVSIHPFADGNGRVARALASAFSYRAVSMPIMILSDLKEPYLDALEAADRGEFQPFTEFMLERALDTLALVRESIAAETSPTAAEALAGIDRLYRTKGGYTQDQVDAAGDRLLELVQTEFVKGFSKIEGSNVRGTVASSEDVETLPPESHRAHVRRRALNVLTFSAPPARASVSRMLNIWLPLDASGDDDIQLVTASAVETIISKGGAVSRKGPTVRVAFSARMRELTPAATGVLQLRAAIFADRIIAELLTELRKEALKSLRSGR